MSNDLVPIGKYASNKYFIYIRQNLTFPQGLLVGSLLSLIFVIYNYYENKWIEKQMAKIELEAENTENLDVMVDSIVEANIEVSVKKAVEEHTSLKEIKKDKKTNYKNPWESLSTAQREKITYDYIKKFAPVAISEMRSFGIPASIILGQGLLESQSGVSTLAVLNNNHFGVKCFSKGCKKNHCSNYTDDSHKDFFRIYPNIWASYRDHSNFLKNGVRYKKLFKFGRDYKKWANGLQNAGYATDRTYGPKLIGVIERYNLHKYDRLK